jgi:hypothetical protein
MHFRHDKEEALCSCVPLAMNRDLALKLDQRGLVDERFGLRVDGVCSICVLDGSDWPCLLCDAFCLVELDIALGDLNPTIVRVALFQCLLILSPFLLVRRCNNAPTASPRGTRSEAHTCPVIYDKLAPFHDGTDIVKHFSFPSDERACVGFL